MVHIRAKGAELARRRVLIVDDNPQVRQDLRTLLPLAGVDAFLVNGTGLEVLIQAILQVQGPGMEKEETR